MEAELEKILEGRWMEAQNAMGRYRRMASSWKCTLEEVIAIHQVAALERLAENLK